MHLSETWGRAVRPHHSVPGVSPGVFAWHGSCAILISLFTTTCSHSAPLLSKETTRGKIQYTLHSPESPARQHVIIAHGFLRTPDTMAHIAESLAKDGIETACIKLKRSNPLNGNQAGNARDMIALRESLGWKNVIHAGFSAGGLSALIASSEDPASEKLILLDPVDQASLGKEASEKIRIPTLAILGQPGAGNARRNCQAMLAAIPGCRTIEIKTATHCDFEARPSTLCHRLTGSKPDAERTTKVHQTMLREVSLFLKTQPTYQP